jgi:GTPase Era involved in 16S rRNA processing
MQSDKAIPVILCANKCDIEHDLTDNAFERYSEEHKFDDYFKTSAKTGENIDLAL